MLVEIFHCVEAKNRCMRIQKRARSSAFAARASNTTARAYASGIRMLPLLLWCWLQLSFSVVSGRVRSLN